MVEIKPTTDVTGAGFSFTPTGKPQGSPAPFSLATGTAQPAATGTAAVTNTATGAKGTDPGTFFNLLKTHPIVSPTPKPDPTITDDTIAQDQANLKNNPGSQDANVKWNKDEVLRDNDNITGDIHNIGWDTQQSDPKGAGLFDDLNNLVSDTSKLADDHLKVDTSELDMDKYNTDLNQGVQVKVDGQALTNNIQKLQNDYNNGADADTLGKDLDQLKKDLATLKTDVDNLNNPVIPPSTGG